MCGCECCISANSMHSYLLMCRKYRLKQIKDRSHNAQNRRFSEISSRIFETYKNAVQPHSFNIYNNVSDISMETMCTCTPKHHGLMHSNVRYFVVISSQVLSYPVRRKINIQQTRVQQLDFMLNVMFHILLFKADVHTTNKQHVHCFPQLLYLTVLPKYTK